MEEGGGGQAAKVSSLALAYMSHAAVNDELLVGRLHS